MVYLLKKNFPSDLPVRQGLSEVFGIGEFFANQICDQLGLSQKYVISQLRRGQMDKITRLVSSYYTTGYDLKKKNNINIRRLIFIGSYRGFRHVNRLPVRGQRTRTNSRTCRRILHH